MSNCPHKKCPVAYIFFIISWHEKSHANERKYANYNITWLKIEKYIFIEVSSSQKFICDSTTDYFHGLFMPVFMITQSLLKKNFVITIVSIRKYGKIVSLKQKELGFLALMSISSGLSQVVVRPMRSYYQQYQKYHYFFPFK